MCSNASTQSLVIALSREGQVYQEVKDCKRRYNKGSMYYGTDLSW